jgi:hypothetical protein
VPVLGLSRSLIQFISGALSLEAKRPGRETDHSTSISAEFKIRWIYTFTPQYAFMTGCLGN